jgi:pimeloyl-ACP methyl ester carboxylesterase
MRIPVAWAIAALSLITASSRSFGATSLSVLGEDYAFPSKIDGLPAKLSDFQDLQLNSFQTSDGVKLSFWEAGHGTPLVFLPGWSSNGAEYINLIYLLRNRYHVYVLDPCNQGRSQHVDYGNRISRFATDLKEFTEHLGITSADFCGHSMGSAILWSYKDLYGAKNIHKAVFVDEPISIAMHPGWSQQQRLDFGAMVEKPTELVAMMSRFLQLPGTSDDKKVPAFAFAGKDTPAFINSQSFAGTFIKDDPNFLIKVLFDHASQDWHAVLIHKINIPVALFTGELSPNLPSGRWAHSAIPNAKLIVFSKEDQGDHLMMFRSPKKFTADLQEFLEQGQ